VPVHCAQCAEHLLDVIHHGSATQLRRNAVSCIFHDYAVHAVVFGARTLHLGAGDDHGLHSDWFNRCAREPLRMHAHITSYSMYT
jgi:hypothetical protein